MKKYLKYIIYAFIVTISFVIDLVTKGVIQNNFALGESVSIIKNFFSLTYIYNQGAAFGMMSGKTIYLIIFSCLVILFILYQFIAYKDSEYMSSSFALLLGGLLGNFYDRLYYGYVRDFLDFNIFGYDFPIFNVADICIVVSICLIIYGIMKYEGGFLNGIKDTSDELGNGTKARSSFNKQIRTKQKSHNKAH